MQLYKYILVLLCTGLSTLSLQAQHIPFSGWVVDGEGEALFGATVSWLDSSSIGAVTDAEGHFSIPRLDTTNGYKLQIRHVGFETVEVEIFPYENHLKLEVPSDFRLKDAVEITSTKRDAFNSTLNPINMETLSACELKRAACCSLAESFENNGSVNVSFSDAVTGAREIEMLGLAGTYTQMMIENRPTLNRLGRAYGLEYIPGSWIESIQVSKGASTVRNGVAGITGQINTELIKPQNAPPFYINLYSSHFGRMELNTNLAHKFNEQWSTGLLFHGNYLSTQIDHNHDHFLDVPLKKQLNGLWRLVHKGDDLHLEFNVQGILDNRVGGQTAQLFEKHDMAVPNRLYEITNNTRRLEAFGKVGYMGFDNPRQSVAVVYGATVHEQKANFGGNPYDGLQRGFYANLIFQTPLTSNLEHNLNAGVTYRFDDFTENYLDVNLGRIEQQSSLFAEYDFQHTFNKEKGTAFGVIVGIRGDWVQTNQYQKITPSPRLNLKYNFNENLVIRASGGRGFRMPNLLIDNFRYMASARSFVVDSIISPEIAWNYGLNMTYNFKLGEREGSFSVDAYRTDFENQLITDIDADATQVRFYNLKGQSFANSVLIAWTQDIIKGLELRLAYKFNDVRSTYNDTLRWQPYSPQHRGLISLHYVTPNEGWQFNANAQFVGPQRLPTLEGNTNSLPEYRQKALAPAYVLLHAQVTKYFKNGFEIYIGAENLGNYRQKAPILGAADPFGENPTSRAFDATAVYAPVMGVMGYAGIRYTFKGKDAIAKDPKVLQAKGEAIQIQTSAQCGMCKTTIDEGLAKVEGIYFASLDMKNKVVMVNYDAKKITPEEIRKAISALGYDADDLMGDPEAYKKLPGCCQKP